MYIERVQVEEGFLAGLDVEFGPGLNTVIGARGTGKTSLIELIRFCLDAPGTSSETSRRSREHAMSILGSGQVTVTLVDRNQRILVTRTAPESAPRASAPFQKPLVFSQTEIETIGLTPSGRISLIDSFLSENEADLEAKPVSEIRSLSASIEQVRKELEESFKRVGDRQKLDDELTAVLNEEKALSSGSSTLSEKTATLQNISSTISGWAANLASSRTVEASLADWYQQIEKARTIQLDFTGLPVDQATQAENAVDIARVKLSEVLGAVAGAYHQLKASADGLNARKLELESQARHLRGEIDVLQAGAGAVMRKGQEVREKYSMATSAEMRVQQLQTALTGLLQSREAALDRLDEIRKMRSMRRETVVASLNRTLGPAIRMRVLRNGQAPAFAATISDLLRGSGLKYGEVVGPLARQLSPRTLVKAVDNFDLQLISNLASISVERAAKLLGYLRGVDLGAVATLNVDDDLQLHLLDGHDYKEFSELSTGQRCTVILPLLLTHQNRMLIVDQPEDHIDNAFITGTLIRSILASANSSQIIFSTHNPNIPVLGDARSVVHMGSDGRRGFALTRGGLHAPNVVAAISSVMEGGADAFEYRANFYGANKA